MATAGKKDPSELEDGSVGKADINKVMFAPLTKITTAVSPYNAKGVDGEGDKALYKKITGVEEILSEMEYERKYNDEMFGLDKNNASNVKFNTISNSVSVLNPKLNSPISNTSSTFSVNNSTAKTSLNANTAILNPNKNGNSVSVSIGERNKEGEFPKQSKQPELESYSHSTEKTGIHNSLNTPKEWDKNILPSSNDKPSYVPENSNLSLLTEKTPLQQNNTSESLQQKQNVFNPDKIFSDILFTSSILPEGSFDDTRYLKIDKKEYHKLNVFSTNRNLKELCETYPHMESLDISNCNMLYEFDCLKKLDNLKEFCARNCQLFTNIDCLANSRELSVLNIAASGVTNIDFAKNFKKLRVLNCSACKIINVNGLSGCGELVELIAWGCMPLGNLDGLEECFNLRCLDLEGTGAIDLFPLVNCKKMELLILDGCDKIKDFSAISALNILKYLAVDGNNIIFERQLENFAGLSELFLLSLKDRKINTLSMFSGLKSLREFGLAGGGFSDLGPIANLTNMAILDITACSSVKDVSCLHKMNKLTKLLASGAGAFAQKNISANTAGSSVMDIQDVDVVANFPKLKALNVSNNPKIRDVNALVNCKDMEEIYLNRCTNIEDVSVLGGLPKLEIIHLESCPKIKELYFLSDLANIKQLKFNGTVVYTPSFTTNLKKCTNLDVFGGNDSDPISKTFINSAKKKVKRQKMLKNIFFINEEEKKV
jgi:hypothetical protein